MGVVGDPERRARHDRRAQLMAMEREKLVDYTLQIEQLLDAAEKRESDRSWIDNPPQGSL